MTAERIHAPQFQLYKESTIPWAPVIPNHWETKRAKSLFKKMERPVRESDEVVTCFRDGTVTLRRNRRESGFTESLKEIGYQGIRPGDLVIHAMDAFAGAIGVSDSAGKGTPVYSVCTPIGEANPLYYAHALREMSRNKWIESLAKGIRERSSDFRFTEFSAQVVPVPPPEEQTAIVRYLDDADQRIRAYVSVKERLIALLAEQRQAVIHQAVTQGLDPNVRLKPSSVEWLGDVPEHWEVMPLKRAFVSMDYGISDSGSQTGGVRLLTMGNIRDGSVTVPSTGGVTAVDQSLLLGKNDLLFNRTNSAELVAKVGLFSGHDSPVTFASYLVRMRSRSSNEPEYLNMALNETTFLAQARREAVPSLHQSNLNPTRYGRIQISLPPKEEQKTILSALAEKTNGLKTSMELAHRQIELIEEYRTRLIADVVTGKIDVREAKP